MQTRTIPFMPENPRYAFAYVPFQQYGNLYPTNNALYKGTIFKDLLSNERIRKYSDDVTV